MVVYLGSGSEVCATLRSDLARRVVDGRIDPAFGDDYQLLSLLDKGRSGAPGNPSVREWRLLARLCRTQTVRFRALPEQMRTRWSGPDSESTAENPSASAVPSPRAPTHEEPEAENYRPGH